jgi:hypothetical protein
MQPMVGSEPDVSLDAVDVQSRSWDGHAWSEWYPLDDAIASRKAKAADTPGLYRLRCQAQTGLIYIGETGDSLRARFRQLRKAMEYAAQGKYLAQGKVGGPPHVAGGCVWKHKCAGSVIEVSWVEAPNLPKRERKGVECELIAAYRKTVGTNPACQFAGDPEDGTALISTVMRSVPRVQY